MALEPEPALFEGLSDLFPHSVLGLDPTVHSVDVTLAAGEILSTASSAAGSDASSHSSHSSPTSPEIAAAGAAAAVSPIEELLNLIDWKNGGRSAPKRVRGDPEKSHEKHVQHEKQRRNELAQAIDEISNLIPQAPAATASNKRTKLAALQEAADYFKRVQDMALVLIGENRRLAASMQDQPPLQPAIHPARSALQGQEVVRLFITTAFLVWIFVGVPTPWTGSASAYVSFGSRHVLSVDDQTPLYFVNGLQSLMSITAKITVVIAVFVVMWIVTLLLEMPKVSAEQLRIAEAHFRSGEVAVERNSNWVVAQKRHMEGMAALQKPYPESTIGEAMFLLLQVIRAMLNLAYVGLWFERLLVYCTGRQEVTLVEARAYMLGFRIGPQDSSPLKWSFARCYGSILASASGYHVAAAPPHLQDELGSRLGLFLTDLPHPCTRLQQIFTSSLLWLAEAQLNPISLDMAPNDVHEWTTLRMLGSPVHQGKLEETFDVIMRIIPALKACTQVKAICAAGLVAFSLGRYRDSFLMLQTGMSIGTKKGMMPVVAVRMTTGSIIMALWQDGKEKDARDLLASYEQMFMCVPDGRSNILPVERFFLYSSKVICAGDDFGNVVAHTRELLSVVSSLGMQRFFNVPFVLELLTERLFGALKLANEALNRPKANATETLVVHQRVEISEMAETVIALLQRASYWATYLSPNIERLRGWLAHLSADETAASYHLNRSLLEARRLGLNSQEKRTSDVMRSLGVAIMGAPTSDECPHTAKVKAAFSKIFCPGSSSSRSGKEEDKSAPVTAEAV